MTIAALGIGATILSTVVGAVGAISQGNATAQEGQYQAAVARNNAVMAENAAQDALARGKIDEANQAIATKQLVARQRTIFAGNGSDVNIGSPVDIQASTAGVGQNAALNIRSNALREATGYRQQGYNFASEAGLADAKSSDARNSGYMNAFGTVLGGAGSVADQWYKLGGGGGGSVTLGASAGTGPGRL